jgi:hypothetical protein
MTKVGQFLCKSKVEVWIYINLFAKIALSILILRTSAAGELVAPAVK